MGIVKKEPSNLNPDVKIPTKVDSFRFWCQKVLPLVYDDSLSYYELLCKVVDYLNNTIADVNTLGTDVDNLNKAFIQLQEYVNNYFSTLDVQEEINKKLDEMASDGTLYEIIRRYTQPIVNEQNNKITVLESRMNTFTQLPSGSTSGDAELQDIRVGYNGNVYNTAGDSVRTQVTDLHNELNNIEELTGNLAKLEDIEIGKAWNGDTNPNRATLYIRVKPNTTYSIVTYGYNFDSIFTTEKETENSKTSVGSSATYTTDIRAYFTTSEKTNIFVLQFIKTNISIDIFKNFKISFYEGRRNYNVFMPHKTSVDYVQRNYKINVKEYGAKGDGSTDDTDAFKEAINELIFIRKNYTLTADNSANMGIGFELYIPSGIYILSDSISIPPFEYEYGGSPINMCPVTIAGDGLNTSILDFSKCNEDVNGLEVDGGFCVIKNIKIFNAKKYGLSLKNRCWKSRIINVFIERSKDYGFFIGNNSFNIVIESCFAYKCGKGGFFFSNGITSSSIISNYANSCGGVGYFFNDNINYTTLISNACDSCGTPYRFGSYNYISMINNGDELCGGHSVVTSGNDDITINGHFSLDIDGSLIQIRGDNNNIIINNGRTYKRKDDTTNPIILSDDNKNNKIIINHLNYSSERTKITGNAILTDVSNSIIANKKLQFNSDNTVSWS